MQNIPQIVRERLQAGATVSGHPDADILTSFAERSLRQPERAGVLAHLAACANCREIVALALPVTESMETAAALARRPWFTWPAFRWGFATAGVALIALGVVEFERHPAVNSATLVVNQIMAKQSTPAQPMAADVQNQASSQNSSATPKVAPQSGISTLAGKDRRALAHPQMHVQPTFKESQAAQEKASPPVLMAQQSANQQLPNGSEEQFAAYNSGPLSRAKPATTSPPQANSADAILANPQWSITAVGGLQRSFDLGKTWQDVRVNASVMPESTGATAAGSMKSAGVESSGQAKALKASANPVFFRAVTTAENEVWAGGSNAALFHSIDGGDHWTRVLPSSSGAVLTGDVISVEFSDPQHGTVTTSTPESWATSDGGQSWQKQ